MFIVVFESGEIKKMDEYCQGDLDACDSGVLDLIDVGPEVPLVFFNGQWHEVESI